MTIYICHSVADETHYEEIQLGTLDLLRYCVNTHLFTIYMYILIFIALSHSYLVLNK